MPTTSPSTTFRPFNRLTWEAAEPPSVEARGITSKEAHVARTESITLHAVDGLPQDIDVAEIAEAAVQAAFATIAENLSGYGYDVTGDFGPDEAAALERVFGLFVHAMAANNPTLADPVRWICPTEQPDEIVTVTVEACEPDEIPRDRGVTVTLTGGESWGSAHCPLVDLTGSRSDVARMLLDYWAAGPAGDVEWLKETMTNAVTVA